MAKSYHTAIVGESKFQPAVRRTTVGDYVDVVVEEGNPHAGDATALRVDNSDGDTIGYIAEDHWLRRAILDEGKGVLAKVDSKAGRPIGIVLLVQFADTPCPRVAYGERLSAPVNSGCLGSIGAALFVGLALVATAYAGPSLATDTKGESVEASKQDEVREAPQRSGGVVRQSR